MNIRTIASGSKGNCYLVDDGLTPILIECGIRFSEIRRAMNFKMRELRGCVASHSHTDHLRAAKDIMKAGIDLYVPEHAAQTMSLNSHRTHIFQGLQQFRIGSWDVLPFPVVHTIPCFGFILCPMSKGYPYPHDEKLLYISDVAYTRYRFSGLTHIMLEINYDEDIVKENQRSGAIDQDYYHRIIKGHMSLTNAKRLLAANDLSKVREIHLIHISKLNGDPERFKKEIQRATAKPVIAH